MRKAAVETLLEIARSDEKVILLTGDIGFMVLEPFARELPRQFFNVGVAEQNMVGVATGLAEAGYIPYLYSIATFAALRPFEFIRNGPVRHHLPVRIFGVGGGFDYGHAGGTHHALEDYGIMRMQPGLTVIVPADDEQTAQAVRATAKHPGPIYFRLGKNECPALENLHGAFELGSSSLIRTGRDVLFVTCGDIAREVLAAANRLEAAGISSGVLVVSTMNPVRSEALRAYFSAYSLVVSVETHFVNGGLGSLVCEVIAEAGLSARVMRCGIDSPSGGMSGPKTDLEAASGLSAMGIAERVQAVWSSSAEVR